MMDNEQLFVGVDVGSTTVKVVVLDKDNNILYKHYERHFSKVREKTLKQIMLLKDILEGHCVHISITGSAGLGMAKVARLPFVQEVYSEKIACDTFLDDVDVVIELGGEDAKILYLTGLPEERMNGSCAGGTGSFIDQMASLLGLTLDELDEYSSRHQKIYSIASRCGVFAKSDIQPLLNQGAKKEDIAASIYQSIVNQTITGLAQGRPIKGRVVFLGGPLTFLMGLRERFVETLSLDEEHAIFPENAEYYIAMGAAVYSADTAPMQYGQIVEAFIKSASAKETIETLEPLFSSQEEYDEFRRRHSIHTVDTLDISTYSGKAFLGVDAGSTTTKLALIAEGGELLYTYYVSNSGEPVAVVLEQLKKIRKICGDRIKIYSAVTGYGEALLQHAFNFDAGVVETIAHYYAARRFDPDVDFILDIGGQDIKCFKIRGGAIDSIMLNEACSSGCGSFIETFARSLGYDAASFSKAGIFARNPVNLGSRCTVFMNSSVKQAQKDGAGVDDIAAGLAISVVKNAIYKVMRASVPQNLGKNIVVQGGTLMSDLVLRAFEKEIDLEVVRPSISGLMGAYGAALYAMRFADGEPGLISAERLEKFSHTSKVVTCGLCANHCTLTVNSFDSGDKYISGNRCQRPVIGSEENELPDIYRFKQEYLRNLPEGEPDRGVIGIPMGLNMYELLPFWNALLRSLGFRVVVSGTSSRAMYELGQHTIPSDTVCYPAKLIHAHLEVLMDKGIETIFYPCMPYNFDEKAGDNHYNCPVVAYYPELVKANISRLSEVNFINDYFSPHVRQKFLRSLYDVFGQKYGISKKEIAAAADAGYNAYRTYLDEVYRYGQEAVRYAREHGKDIIVLAGRPYHVDPEINHGIDKLITSLGLVVISEDSVSRFTGREHRGVLNQWTYHARLYSAARYVCTQPDMQLVQLVSFGCGLDAITTDEVMSILEEGGKNYTQIKIDEISNLGAATIRLRSLIETVNQKKRTAAPAR